MGEFMPTHAAPPEGLQVWDAPDPSRPAISHAQARVQMQLLERRGAWARVQFSNGWGGWVDGRRLVDLVPPPRIEPPPRPEAQPERDLDPGFQPRPRPEVRAPRAEPSPRPEPEPRAEPSPRAEPEPRAEPQAEAERRRPPAPLPQPGPDLELEPRLEPRPQPRELGPRPQPEPERRPRPPEREPEPEPVMRRARRLEPEPPYEDDEGAGGRGWPIDVRSIRPTPGLIGSAAVLVGTLLSWIRIEGASGSAFDVPLEFLWNSETASRSALSIGLLFLVLAAVAGGFCFLPGRVQPRRVIGGVVAGVAVLYTIQLQRVLSAVEGVPSLPSALGFGVLVAFAGGVALIVDRSETALRDYE